MKISLCILTFNRWNAVSTTLEHNIKNAGLPIHEIVHVDNGSDGDFCEKFKDKFNPSVQVRHSSNLGVSVGYNRALMLATGTHLMVTGVDRLMPDNWALILKEHFEAISNTGCISIYLPAVDDHTKNRHTGSLTEINGKKIIPSVPVEAKMIERQYFQEVGLFREDLGIYGHEDHYWYRRAEKVAKELGKINYIIPEMVAQHNHGEDYHFMMKEGISYHDYKRKMYESTKDLYLEILGREGLVYHNPYFKQPFVP